MLTAQQLRAATGCTAARADEWLPHITRACETFAINTPARLAAFLAQIGHESGRLAYVREIWGPTPAQLRYEGRADLGNTQPGDGRRYMGRGLIQTTGRANYCATRDGLAAWMPDVPDLEAVPALLERPDLAAMSAAWYWQSRRLNALADAGDFLTITKRINGGTNGLADRLALHEAAKAVLQ
jgi:putative chitinase